MKVGIYIPSNITPDDGGSFGYYSQLLKTIFNTQTKHEFVVLTKKSTLLHFSKYNILDKNARIVNISSKSDAHLFILRILQFVFKTLYLKKLQAIFDTKIYNRYTKILKNNKIDFIYYLTPGEYLTLDIPYITTIWDIGYKNVNHFPEVSSNYEYDKRDNQYTILLSRASLVAVESEAGKNDIIFYFRIKPEKIVVIPLFPGNVIEQIVCKEEQNKWLNKKGLTTQSYLFYPAQFWAHKNHINLLKALAILKNKYRILFYLVFTGSDKGNLQYVKTKIKELGLEQQIQYWGLVSEQELSILYQNAFALVMPTFLGPTTMPVLEAIALSCPVICSNFDGHKEQLSNAALYFSPNNPYEIAENIKRLIDNPELRKSLIDNGNQVVSSGKNSIQNSINILLRAFDDFENIRDCWK